MESESAKAETYTRVSERVSLRTSVTAIAKDMSGEPIVYKAWTDDISLYGARLLCQQSIEAEEIFASDFRQNGFDVQAFGRFAKVA